MSSILSKLTPRALLGYGAVLVGLLAGLVALFGRDLVASWISAAWRFFTTGATPAVAGLALLTLAACGDAEKPGLFDTSEGRAAFADALIDEVQIQIHEANRLGLDPLQKGIITGFYVNAGCSAIRLGSPVFVALINRAIERREGVEPVDGTRLRMVIAKACGVAVETLMPAAPAAAPEPAPRP